MCPQCSTRLSHEEPHGCSLCVAYSAGPLLRPRWCGEGWSLRTQRDVRGAADQRLQWRVRDVTDVFPKEWLHPTGKECSQNTINAVTALNLTDVITTNAEFKIVKCVVSGISACYRTTLQHLRSLLIRSPQKEAHRFRVNFPTRHGGTPHAFSSLLSHSPNVNQSPGRFTAAISTPDAPKTRQRDKETVTQKSESGSLNQTWYAHMHA